MKSEPKEESPEDFELDFQQVVKTESKNKTEPDVKLDEDDFDQLENSSFFLDYDKPSRNKKPRPIPRNYVCVHCSASFTNKKHIKSHVVRTHPKPSRIQFNICQKCGQEFDSRRRYREHMRRKHPAEGSELVCGECGGKFKYRETLKRHLLRRHSDQNFAHGMTYTTQVNTCPICLKEFRGVEQFETHKQVHENTSRKEYPCPLCHVVVKKWYTLREHLKRHKSERNLRCEQCPLLFKMEADLKRHVHMIHEGGKEVLRKEFHCPICNVRFLTQKSLDYHETKHVPGNLDCRFCPSRLTTAFQRKAHERLTHNEGFIGEEVMSCDICGFSQFSRYSLKMHMKKHETTGLLKCDECGKSDFRHKSHLVAHMRKHSGLILFTCEFCPKQSRHRKTMFLHWLKAHSEVIKSETDESESEKPTIDFENPPVKRRKTEYNSNLAEIVHSIASCSNEEKFTSFFNCYLGDFYTVTSEEVESFTPPPFLSLRSMLSDHDYAVTNFSWEPKESFAETVQFLRETIPEKDSLDTTRELEY